VVLFGWNVWRGESGRRYRFKITLTKAGIPQDGVSGVYIFVRRRFVFFLEPLYVGKATSFRERLLGHEKWGKAYWFYGATERHICRLQDVNAREAAEEDLIRGLKPPMNDMLIPRDSKDLPVHAELRAKRGWWRFGAQSRSAPA
jgi:hypothetical protein